VTLSYKQVAGNPVLLDVYPPPSHPKNDETIPLIPAVVYFHGGGLAVGNRQSWFPTWLYERVTSAGYAFISADYQLIPPATGHEVVQDIQDLFAFLGHAEISFPSKPHTVPATVSRDSTTQSSSWRFRIDPEAIAVAGSSAGGLCAYLAAIHCDSPKPKAILSLYGMGGDFLTAHQIMPKDRPFFLGREMLDPKDFLEYLYPSSTSLQPITDSPLAYHPSTYHIPGYPANPRMLVVRLSLQLGIFNDFFTGEHEPSLSCRLREALEANSGVSDKTSPTTQSTPGKIDAKHERMRSLIPDRHLPLYPQFGVTPAWPPTLLFHGTNDSAVHIGESRHMRELLESVAVPVRLIEFEGKEHSFDYEPDAEVNHGKEFDEAAEFLRQWIGKDRSAS